MPATALLIMDVQQGLVERLADRSGPLLDALARAIAAARAATIPVIYVRIGFRDGRPEISPDNRTFSALGSAAGFGAGHPDTQVHPAVAPAPDDVVVIKKRVSAFVGSDLEVVLRAQQVRHLVLAGISTSGVVLSTLRAAADLDYRLSVLSDGCLDPDAEVHRVLLEKVFPRQASVVSVDEWAATLNPGTDQRVNVLDESSG